MINQMVFEFLLGFDATLDTGCGFWELLHSLREVFTWAYKRLRLLIILQVEHGVNVMTVGSQSGRFQFENYR